MTAGVIEKEIWESQIPGRTSFTVEDERGKKRTESAYGKGQRLRITTQERLLVEERIRSEDLNPFRNGTLVHINRRSAEDGGEPAAEQEMTDDDLSALFALEDAEFEEVVPTLTELNARRLNDLSKVEGSPARRGQGEWLEEYLKTAYPIGGDTPTYRELHNLNDDGSPKS